LNAEQVLKKYNIKITQYQGDEIRCLCPFHDDAKTSFSINIISGAWYCHAQCGGGGIISLVAKLENCSYDEAKLKVQDGSVADSKRFSILQTITNQKQILKEPKIVDFLPCIGLPEYFVYYKNEDDCPQYLLDRINFDTIKHFRLGTCTDGKYESMIIIPVILHGKVYGYQARNTGKSNDNRVYLMPDGFHIKKFLFNYDGIVDCKKIYITEGAFSAMSMCEKGYKNVVSSFSGAPLNVSQFNFLIDSSVRTIVFCYDSDKTGINGVSKSYERYKNYFRIYYAVFPDELDPNDLSKKQLDRILKYKVLEGQHA